MVTWVCEASVVNHLTELAVGPNHRDKDVITEVMLPFYGGYAAKIASSRSDPPKIQFFPWKPCVTNLVRCCVRNSSSLINDKAYSIVTLIGGLRLILSSLPDALILESCFPLHGFTVKSLSLLFIPTIIPSYILLIPLIVGHFMFCLCCLHCKQPSDMFAKF